MDAEDTERRLASLYGGRRAWPLVPAPVARRYYFHARAWVVAGRYLERLPRRRAAEYVAIDRIGDVWGLHLDELGASYRMVKWVAWGGTQAQREKRYRAVVALFGEDTDEPIGRRFLALAASMPKVGRQAARAQTEQKGDRR